MLLQTNSYIVPKERRAEHARLIRRFRQALARIGCDQFEVYEQVGANWSPGGANGRYVQIMRFRDRQHQQAVQAAEANDHGAQTIIAEFCELINFPYQQQHGYFATGFYTSVLPSGPRQAVEYDSNESEETAGGPAAADVVEPFGDNASAPDVDAGAGADESRTEPQAVSQDVEEPSGEAQTPEEPAARPEAEKHAHEAESAALAEDLVIDNGGTGSSLGSFLDSMNDGESKPPVGDNGHRARFEEPQFGNPDPGFVEPEIPVAMVAPTAAHDATATGAPSLNAAAELSDTPNATADSIPPLIHEELPAELPEAESTVDEFEMIDHGLLFEDELPGESSSASAHHAVDHSSFGLDETATSPAPQSPAPAAMNQAPHEELMPTVSDFYGKNRAPIDADSASDDAALDALLDDANLLDTVPFPGALEEAPRLQPRRDSVAGNGHNVPAEKEDDLLEIEAFIRQLEEQPSGENGHRAT